ncbi:uncharacterized protein TNIN_256561 [Trichonephila inaurata madagascariensis]|uniref:Tesmin/TSO1-like CXC domain-containing protein n=1 Tax=Trichonephila inaurata madagascariensis TaxID=2747483 RepID=A0A8X6YCW8_9ARAC|nr:uncharacterized protein TNIN_256561 [Trichonephila inaurata madagascariensis]
MNPVGFDLNENNVTYIMDDGFLLYRVVWSKDDTFSIILDKYVKYLQKHYGSKIVVVFDGYSNYSKNIKTMEQPRRTASLSKSNVVCFDETMIVSISQDNFLSNRWNDLEPQEWGWILRNEFLEPIMTILSPAPDELLNTIFCNCKNGCGLRCGCRKSGLQCSSACGRCNGQACFNASRYESDLDEDCTFDPEILQDLETNILDEKNNEKELEILE